MNLNCTCSGRGWFTTDMMGEGYTPCRACNTHEIWHGMPRLKTPPAVATDYLGMKQAEASAPNVDDKTDLTIEGMRRELADASAKWPPFNSAHEGFAVLAEEVDELWDHVKVNQKRRDLPAMRKEALQVAAMALRFALDVCDETRGRK